MTLCQLKLTMAGVLLLASSLHLTIAVREANIKRPLYWDTKSTEGYSWDESPAILFPKSRNNMPENPQPNFAQLTDSRRLKKFLGEYDTRYVSIKKPRNNGSRVPEKMTSRKELLASMPSELKNLQFPVFGSRTGELGTRASQKLRLWLWRMSSCHVLPLWKDLGPTIWPRYINVGQCSQKSTCSFPKGMKCRPSKIKEIPTVWWFCSKRLRDKDFPCVWVTFHTKVLEKCTCSC